MIFFFFKGDIGQLRQTMTYVSNLLSITKWTTSNVTWHLLIAIKQQFSY